ncbi:MAG TPA: hypothetical protein EYO90_06730 [Candidatus Latescibacteria bacterium]|nr:hypothetical protein [Candidatus Latescibacterota bacterium]
MHQQRGSGARAGIEEQESAKRRWQVELGESARCGAARRGIDINRSGRSDRRSALFLGLLPDWVKELLHQLLAAVDVVVA